MHSKIRTIGARRVVLKALEDDCLLNGQLHPSIRLRLDRIRQLPLMGVASLLGVERIDGEISLVWEFIEGSTLSDASVERRNEMAREVRAVIAAMHDAGIVHGNLHEQNVILDQRRRVKLTHLSPLLWEDPEIDFIALDKMFPQRADEEDLGLKPRAWPRDRVRVSAALGAIAALCAGIAVTALILWYASVVA